VLLPAELLYGPVQLGGAGMGERASPDQKAGMHDLQGELPLPFLELRQISGQCRALLSWC